MLTALKVFRNCQELNTHVGVDTARGVCSIFDDVDVNTEPDKPTGARACQWSIEEDWAQVSLIYVSSLFGKNRTPILMRKVYVAYCSHNVYYAFI